jgi:hypothetical protein
LDAGTERVKSIDIGVQFWRNEEEKLRRKLIDSS